MQHQGAHVADVGHVDEHLDALDETTRCRQPSAQREGEYRPVSALEVVFGLGVVGVGRQAGVVDALDLVLRLQPAGDLEGIARLSLDAETQGLDALADQEGVQR